MIESSIPTVLRERASLQPNDIAFTFMDYDHDWEGKAESLTWAQLYRRTLNLAHELRSHAEIGDRVVILAPQCLDYIIAFLGSLEAGLIAVPLPMPSAGAHDERITSVMSDTSPTVILTTSHAVAAVDEYAQPRADGSAPKVIEVDQLDLETRRGPGLRGARPEIAYLQYTSGSTRTPAGVVITHKNLSANFEQLMSDYFGDFGRVPPPDATFVSWLPFYHDMGLLLGVLVPILSGTVAVLTSPVAFLQRPARWMHLLARNSRAISAGPNFAFELAAGRTSDEDMAGLDLSGVIHILSGSERVHPATINRFIERFSRFGFRGASLRPSYGLAEAVVYVATRMSDEPPRVVEFDTEKLSAGHARRNTSETGTPLVSYGMPQSPIVRIVDPETRNECPEGTTGEIWVHGDNVAMGYWQKPESKQIFSADLVGGSAGTPATPWLRTGDLGFVSDDELFIMGRIKDLLIVYGRNHSPDDIESTVVEITRGRVAAISVPDDRTEHLVVIVERKKRGDTPEEASQDLENIKREVTAAIANSHGLKAADLVLVPPGSIPITTSGKVKRAACVEQYRHDQFARLDA
ncbi:fatty-acid--AMP ligase FAAL24/FadD24 [soil metagenome]